MHGWTRGERLRAKARKTSTGSSSGCESTGVCQEMASEISVAASPL